MRILRHYNALDRAARGGAVALGNFDGLHHGHAAVIARAQRIASDRGVPFGVLTFEPHPRRFFQPRSVPFRITPFRAKMRRFADLGVDCVYNLHFDQRLADMLAQDFVRDVLVAGLGVGHVVVGPEFVFGKGRRGNATILRHMAAMEGFGFTELDAVRHGEARYSSTDIRVLLRRGQVDRASALLGRTWEIEGRVERGAEIGRTLGFPTANIALDDALHPGPGIFAVRAGIEGRGATQWYDGAAYIGSRPTFDGQRLLLETNLFDFDGDLYGRRLRVAFVQRVRNDQTFDSAESLRVQMIADCQRARQILAGDARYASANPPAA